MENKNDTKKDELSVSAQERPDGPVEKTKMGYVKKKKGKMWLVVQTLGYSRITQRTPCALGSHILGLCSVLTLKRRGDDNVKVQSVSFNSPVFSSQPDEQ